MNLTREQVRSIRDRDKRHVTAYQIRVLAEDWLEMYAALAEARPDTGLTRQPISGSLDDEIHRSMEGEV